MRRLELGAAATVAVPWRDGRRWLKRLAFVGLIPVAWVLSWAFADALRRAAADENFWLGDQFFFFAMGATIWLLWFFASMWMLNGPHPLRAYVWGHEMTHAIWVWMWRGRVTKFEGWNRKGGYIVTDTHNFWIALAPYFYPIYSLAVIIAFGVARIFCDVAKVNATFIFLTPVQWLMMLLGATWAFHLSFTCWMIPKGQTDLQLHGTPFSLMVIYIMNLLLLTVFIVFAAPELSFAWLGRDVLHRAQDVWRLVGSALHFVRTHWPR
jgi:hypothetical protein